MQEFEEKLKKLIDGDRIVWNEPMKKHTTFRIGGPADWYLYPRVEELPEILSLAKAYQVPVTIVGNGSNLLVGDKGVRGLVLSISKGADLIKVQGETITAQGGALLSKVASEAAGNSLTGFEFAAGIPGTIGGAVVMNAGAYGGEMKDVLTEVTVLTEEGEFLVLKKDALELSYRHSVIPEKHYIVTEVVIQLTRGREEAIRGTMEELKKKRLEKQPLEYPSAGSTFKRPEGHFAGKLIEDANLRGYRVGGAQVSEKHCGFVINRDNATAEDVCRLMEDVKERVYKEGKVLLEPEVKFIGEFK